jgi:hypothetical protein
MVVVVVVVLWAKLYGGEYFMMSEQGIRGGDVMGDESVRVFHPMRGNLSPLSYPAVSSLQKGCSKSWLTFNPAMEFT